MGTRLWLLLLSILTVLNTFSSFSCLDLSTSDAMVRKTPVRDTPFLEKNHSQIVTFNYGHVVLIGILLSISRTFTHMQ